MKPRNRMRINAAGRLVSHDVAARGYAPPPINRTVGSSPPPAMKPGEEKRCIAKRQNGAGVGWDAAIRLAEAMTWWPRVTRRQPYGDARYWIWILRAT